MKNYHNVIQFFKKNCIVVLTAVLFTIAGVNATACPNCKEAFSTTTTGQSSNGETTTDGKTGAPKVQQASLGTAYSVSILLMLGMPMTVVGAIGYILYTKAQRFKNSRIEEKL